MKTKPLIFAVIVLAFNLLTANAQGIKFEQNKTWFDVLDMANTADKLVFVDVYADWCGPCKAMDKTIFPNVNVAKSYNDKFINYKIDAEKGVGPDFAKEYHIVSYPTYLFVDSEGTLIYRTNGYMEANEFLKEAVNAQLEKKEPMTLVMLDNLYPVLKKDTAFMYKYLQRRTKLRLDNADLLDEYCMLLDTAAKGSTQTLQLIADNGNFLAKSLQIGPALTILLNHQDKLSLLTNTNSITSYIGQAQSKTLAKAIALKNDRLLALLLSLNANQVMDFYDDRTSDSFVMKYYYGTGQYPRYLTVATNLVDNKLMKLPIAILEKKDSATLAEVTISMKDRLAKMSEKDAQAELAGYKHTQSIQVVNRITAICNDILRIPGNTPQVYANGKRWMKHAVDLAERDSVYYVNVYPSTLHTYAVYLYKSGEKAKAIDIQTKALNLMVTKNLARPDELVENRLALGTMQAGKPLTYTIPVVTPVSVAAKPVVVKKAVKPGAKKKA